jgi:hypothetical protein
VDAVSTQIWSAHDYAANARFVADLAGEVVALLAPRGRFVGEFGGHGNVAAIVVALNAVLARGTADYVRLRFAARLI